jgi:hypothetical protein
MRPRIIPLATITTCVVALTLPPARADRDRAVDPKPDPGPSPETLTIEGIPAQGNFTSETLVIMGDPRGVAEDFLVLPRRVDVGGRLRTITADGGLGTGRLKLTDVALFDLHAQWAIAQHYELDGSTSVLGKQPAGSHEHVFQGGTLGIRRDVGPATAVGLSGTAMPLIGIRGHAFRGAAMATHLHRLNEWVSFRMSGGADAVLLRAAGVSDHPSLVEAVGQADPVPVRATDLPEHPYLVEATGQAAVLVRAGNWGGWGGWAGLGYALPVVHGGHDPVSGMPLDPQPRLDLNLGTAVQLADPWDCSIELSILDRGELADPATRLPVLDGGFDQIQLVVGVSRRFTSSR